MSQLEKRSGSLSGLSLNDLLMRRKSLRRELLERAHLQSVRIAVLGGSTTNEVVKFLELWLLDSGLLPTFHETEYGRFYIDAVHDPQALIDFKPDVIYVHTSVLNIRRYAPTGGSRADFEKCVQTELKRFQEIWAALEEKIGCLMIQNNFEFPPYAILGNLDATTGGGHTRFVAELNREFAMAAESNNKLLIQDVCSIAARIGLDNWFDRERWFSYKLVTTLAGSRALAISLAAIIRAMFGKARKCLVLDLDNTLWGGVIGDDGVDRIHIGRETPVAEAYTAFQEYCLSLRDRGVLLAVCSKNDEEVAKQGFQHPDSVLKLEHLASFKANWDPKHQNIELIAKELNLGADSFVFVDDNPAEREIVAGQVSGIAVPNVGDEVVNYAGIIEAERYFEQLSLSKEDVERAALYQDNARREEFQAKFADYGDYLDSLEMVAEIDKFNSVYLQRIAQLTNKTNQFNATARRYTLAEMERIKDDPSYLGLYCKLSDRFGDHGLISVVLGHLDSDALHLDLWLMSCRVLKREIEMIMLDALVEHAAKMGVTTIYGYYLPTAKNGMVADLYPRLSFFPYTSQRTDLTEKSTAWTLSLVDYKKRNKHTKLMEISNV
jgi:FkbH-like protein